MPASPLDEWVGAFAPTASDLEHITHQLIEREVPLSTRELLLLILERQIAEEQARVRAAAVGDASPYLPGGTFSVGQTLSFPALRFAIGRVAETRVGSNPLAGSFQVITVDFADGKRREFAAQVESHPLNSKPTTMNGGSDSIANQEPGALADAFATRLEQRLDAALDGTGKLLRISGKWFSRDLLVQVDQHQLNLAEAALDMAGGGPLSTEQIAPQIDLPTGVNSKLMVFSLAHALHRDDRFDEVGPTGEVLWYLNRLEPDEVLHPPRMLQPAQPTVRGAALTPELRRLAMELDDEYSEHAHPANGETQVRLVLTYPHRRAGTLPLTPRLAAVFPTARISPRVKITLVDGHTGKQHPGWVVRRERFVWGLGPIFAQYETPAGSFLSVARGEQAGEYVVTVETRRPVADWLRSANAPQGQLRFSMSKRSLGVQYMDELVILAESMEQLDILRARNEQQATSLEQLVQDVFRELVKLTPQGTVHAKTLYGAVNIARRATPESIFAELVQRPSFVHVGDAYWRFESQAAAA